jgi:hypothetical protein
MNQAVFQALFGSMRPNTKPDQFRRYDDFKIRAIRVWARKIIGHPVPDDQILFVCAKAGLIHRSLRRLDQCSETELTRMFRWIGQQIFAAGYDSYFAEFQ